MKKIYMILAVIALLTLSLNAQVESKQSSQRPQLQKAQLKGMSKASHRGNMSFNDLLRTSIKGMASILPDGGNAMRAPLRYDATQYYTLGPFEGDNFDFGYGFPNAYDANQDVTITTELLRSEFEGHLGDSIVGFRLALYGDGTKMAKVDEFVVHPSTSTSILNGGYSWSLKDLNYENPEGGDEPPVVQVPVYNDIVITSSGTAVNIRSITVYSESSAVSGGSWSYTSNGSTLPTGWSSQNMSNYSTGSCIYLSSNGSITIPHSLIDGKSNITVVINTNQDSGTNYVYVNSSNQSQPAQPLTTTYTNYTWSIAPSGYSTSGGSTQTIEVYKKITSTAELTSGGQYLIVYETGSRAFNGGLTTLDAASNYINVTITDNTIPANATTDAAAFTITANGNYYRIRSASGYYIGRSTNSNGITTSTTTSTNINNTITFNSGNANIQGTVARYMRYNTQTNQFRYLSNTGGAQVQLYKRVTETVEVPSSGSVDGDYVNLATGQWHEFYLDEPVEFQMPTEATSLLMGYDYLQYTSSNTSQVLNPAAFNSQSTGHSHYVHLTQGSSSSSSVGDITISVPSGFTVSFYDIEVLDGNTFEVLTSWNSDGAIGGTYNGTNYYSLPTGWTISSTYFYQENAGSADDPVYLAYLSTQNQASITIANSALQGRTNVIVYIVAVGWEDDQTVSVNGNSQTVNNAAFSQCEWDNVFNVPVAGWYGFTTTPAGDLAVQLIFKDGKPTPEAPTVTSSTPEGGTTTTITITPDAATDGQLVYYVVDQDNQQTQNLTFTRGTADYTVTVHAYTTETTNYHESPEAVVTVTVPALPVTAEPVITWERVGDNVVITATGDGTVTLNAGGQTATGNGTASITIPCGADTQSIVATATAQDVNHQVSPTATATVTVPYLETAAPVISYTDGDDAVTVTATGDGTVIMYVDGVAVTQPYVAQRHMQDYTITVTATAQESGHHISETTTSVITVTGLITTGGWQLMTGTYSGHQSLSFVDSLTNKAIMFADSISAMTFDNHHPDHYDYWLEEAGHSKTSNLVTIPVFKTYSTMFGLYTQTQVDEDTLRTLTANSPNVTLTYDINTHKDMYNYSLYRSAINSDVDSIKADTQPVSKLTYEYMSQLFGESQNLDPYNVQPNYQSVGSSVVKRVDYYFNNAVGQPKDYENYVPVIWTMGSHTGRTDGKNNSYGSDIKRNTLGDVVATIEVESSDYKVKDQEGNWVYGNGVWSYNNQLYTVYTPMIYITGTPPALYEANDGDTVTYEPYMFRAWCLNENVRDFVRDPVTQLLTDNGALTAPILLDTHVKTIDLDTIGGTWEYGMDRLQWSFAAPVGLTKDDLTFAVRFYYRAVLKSDSGMPLLRRANRDGLVPDEQYLIVETTGNPDDIWTGIDDMFYDAGRVPVSTTYVNSLGQTSNRPFEGLNIIVTRYSDGTSSTVKVMR